MSLYHEIFDRCYHELAGTADLAVRRDYERKRYNRAVLALRSQNYFLSASFQNASAAVGATGVGRTLAIERPLIIRGGGVNSRFMGDFGIHTDSATFGVVNLQITRSGSNRAQISRDALRSAHYLSDGQGQGWALDWPMPWRLEPNEIIQVQFTQVAPSILNQWWNVGFYGVAVDPTLRCDEDLLESVREQVRQGGIQKPRYVHLKTDSGGGTICFPAFGSNQRAVANTIEVAEHMLILGWRRYQIDVKSNDAAEKVNSTMRLVVTGGKAFSRVEIPVNAFELFARPDEGYFKFAVPHFVPKGSSLSLSITSTITRLIDQFEGEIELLCVTV